MIAKGVSQGNVDEDGWERMQRVHRRLETDDYRWVAEHCASCLEVGAQLERRVDVKENGQEILGVELAGVTANMERIEDKTIADGRFLLPHEIESAMLVTVIGDELKEKFFESVDPIGKSIKLGGLPFRIVGVERKRGAMFGQSLDKLAYIPLTTYQKMYGRRQSLQIHGKARSREEFPRRLKRRAPRCETFTKSKAATKTRSAW
jgi:putative ABC transport system permease protein